MPDSALSQPGRFLTVHAGHPAVGDREKTSAGGLSQSGLVAEAESPYLLRIVDAEI